MRSNGLPCCWGRAHAPPAASAC